MSGPAMKFRPATPKDSEVLNALVNSAYRGDSSRQGWTTEADLLDGQRTDREAIEETIRERDTVMLVGHSDDGELTACVVIRRLPGDRCYLGMLTVKPALQSAGIGKKLLEAAENHAREVFGSSVMEMNVFTTRHELIAWYERRGYHVTPLRRPFNVCCDPRLGIAKVQGLEFLVMEKSLS